MWEPLSAPGCRVCPVMPSQPVSSRKAQEVRDYSQPQEVNPKLHLPVIPLTIKQKQKAMGYTQGCIAQPLTNSIRCPMDQDGHPEQPYREPGRLPGALERVCTGQGPLGDISMLEGRALGPTQT